MFKKVRRNFIIIAMSSITLVLLTVNIVIDITNKNRQVADSDEIITAIENTFSLTASNDSPDPKIGNSRYFTVKYDSSSKEFTYNLVHIETSIISETTAKNYTREVIASNNERGYKDEYRFHMVKPTSTTYMLVFLDCKRSIQNYRNYTLITLYSSLGALAVCFLIIFFGSKLVIKPIKESYEKQNRFITNASHELKTPLSIISANNELLEIKKGESQYSKTINKQVNRMSNMIKDLTDLSKLNENLKTSFENINVSQIINKDLKEFSTICKKENIKLTKKIHNNLFIVANKSFVNQIFSIVLDNALKYTHGFVDISLTNDKKNVVFRESNNSKHIEEGDLIKYTERFYRGNKDRNKSEGSGIGLSLLEELVRKINGKLKIYGKNNTYNIEIIFSNKNKIK